MNTAWILVAIACLFNLQSCLAELKFVQTIFRHGNRNPTNDRGFYPKDPYKDLSYEPEGLGGLTNAGKMAAYKLGKFFRERYDQFLGPTYSKKDIFFRADEVDRVVMTGQLVAAGLFPPQGEQIWNSHLDWQPIPVWAPSLLTDYLYNGMVCPNYSKWRFNVEKTNKEIINFINKNKHLYKFLTQHTGGNITQHATFNLRQILYAQQDIDLKLPGWTNAVFPAGKLDELAVYDILIRTGTLELKQLLGGVWIREWLNNVDNFINKKDTRKVFMYAGHDLTLAPILVALDNFDYKIPSYCSSIMFELHENNNQYYVQMFHRNDDIVRTLKIPGCGDKMCPLDTFKNFVAPVLPKDIATLCGPMDDIKIPQDI